MVAWVMRSLLVLIAISAAITGCIERVRVPAPPAERSYVSMPFKKVINPAFIDEVQHKWLHVEVLFRHAMTAVTDLPPEYRDKYVRFAVSDPDDQMAQMPNVVIPKAKSDPVFSLKWGDRIEMFVYAQPLLSRSGITGATQRKLLLVVEELRQK